MPTNRRIVARKRRQTVITPAAVDLYKRMLSAKSDAQFHNLDSDLSDLLNLPIWCPVSIGDVVIDPVNPPDYATSAEGLEHWAHVQSLMQQLDAACGRATPAEPSK